MLYCFDTRIPKNWIYMQREKEIARLNQNGILFDGDTKQFIDFSGKTTDIKGKIVFPRTGSTQVYEMNDEIVRQGGILILTNDDINKIDSWPNYYQGDRKIQILKGKDLIDEDIIAKIEDEYGKEIFFKTKEKNFSSIIPIALLKDKTCVFYKALLYHLNEEFIISEKMELVKDRYGTKEYRCFIRDNKVMNISRMTNNVLHQIDEKVLIYANKVVEGLKKIFPSDYVLDIVEKQKDNQIEMDIVEINPIHASGLYLYNSIMEQSLDLLHNNIWNLPKEWKENKDDYCLDGTMIEDRGNLYEFVNSFASDIRSIYLTGSRGVIFSEQRELGVEEFAQKGTGIINFSELEELEDEEELEDYQSPGDDYETDEEDIEKIKTLFKEHKI